MGLLPTLVDFETNTFTDIPLTSPGPVIVGRLGELLDRNGGETPNLPWVRAVFICGELLGRAVSMLLVEFLLEDVGIRGSGNLDSSETSPNVFIRSELIVARVLAAKGSLNRLELLISDCATDVPKSSMGEVILANSISKGLRLLVELSDSVASGTGLSAWLRGWEKWCLRADLGGGRGGRSSSNRSQSSGMLLSLLLAVEMGESALRSAFSSLFAWVELVRAAESERR